MDNARTVKRYRKMIAHGDHLEAPDTGPPWTVLWHTKPPSDGRWSAATATSEQAAIERAAHFMKLGFVVHAIQDPSGAIAMDQAQMGARFGAAQEDPAKRRPKRGLPSAELVARAILRRIIDKFAGTPGRVLNASVLHALSSPEDASQAEAERALSYAIDRGWLTLEGEMLTLTSAGYAAAS